MPAHSFPTDTPARAACAPAALPVPRGTILAIIRTAASAEATGRQLAAVMLRDASFTAQALKIVNSACFNRTGRTITDLRLAIMLLGFERIREIALTAAVLENVLTPARSHKVMALLMQSFLVALQARSLAKLYDLEHRQEIFVAALLSRLGEIWYFSDATSAMASLGQAGCPTTAGRQNFAWLGRRLAEQWGLGGWIQDILQESRLGTPIGQCLQQAGRLVECCGGDRQQGELAALYEAIAMRAKRTPGEIRHELERNFKYAADVHRIFLLRGRLPPSL